jgi:hypothetical protein
MNKSTQMVGHGVPVQSSNNVNSINGSSGSPITPTYLPLEAALM